MRAEFNEYFFPLGKKNEGKSGLNFAILTVFYITPGLLSPELKTLVA